MPAPTRPNLKLTPSTLFDAIILGAGAAGLSAALVLSRVKRSALVFDTSSFRNAQAHHAHAILSRDHQPAPEILQIGRAQIEQYGTTHFVARAVVQARKVGGGDDSCFEVEDASGDKWRGKKIVLAMGARDIFPDDIEGYGDCWGRDIYQCLVCDGIERSGRPAGVLGFASPMQVHNVTMMFQFGCPSVTIFCNGPFQPADAATADAMAVAKAKGAVVDERRIRKFVHLDADEGMAIHFEDGTNTSVAFLAHKPVTMVNAPQLGEALGVNLVDDGMGGRILKRNEPFGESNVQGVFVAGDAGAPMKQFTKAMFDGVAAGAGVNFQLCTEGAANVAKTLKSVTPPPQTAEAKRNAVSAH